MRNGGGGSRLPHALVHFYAPFVLHTVMPLEMFTLHWACLSCCDGGVISLCQFMGIFYKAVHFSNLMHMRQMSSAN
jgi:hypothetical protein